MSLDAEATALTRLLLRENTINPPGDEARSIAHAGRHAGGGGLRDAQGGPGARPAQPDRPDRRHRSRAPALGFTGHVDIVPAGRGALAARPVRRRDRRRPAVRARLGRHEGRRRGHGRGGPRASPVAARRAPGSSWCSPRARRPAAPAPARSSSVPGSLGRVGALVVGEPTGLAPRLGHRGVIWIRAALSGPHRARLDAARGRQRRAQGRARRDAAVGARFRRHRPSRRSAGRRSMSAGSKAG